ncbi:unnamed protein product [Rotaria socialis]|uniref:Uncharacterized protein n=1 Tax=Rotaria socialis TaxID=392032 RepID=A0A819ZLV2_9BILA|nr:unnamed protein product [Rotaria socialis]CAF3447529.1 unnamed protein product [Rotaria socialis]CAF4176049.1 unnamed protein product [Rotaria socialis]CAF4274270.1 unnamed protein product [Rotaria socialis]
MNLNTGYFAAYYCRRKQANAYYRVPLNTQQQPKSSFVKSERSSIEDLSFIDSFLPTIPTTKDSNDGHRPYRRNDFANNHLFIAKNKLARVFLDQPAIKTQSSDDLTHLFDRYEQKQKNRDKNKFKQQESHADNRNGRLSVLNLTMKPPFPLVQTADSHPTVSHHRGDTTHVRTKAPGSSTAWINPVITEYLQARSRLLIRHDLEPDEIINELLSRKSHGTLSPLDSSLSYVKSIINVAASSQQRRS